MLTSHSSWQEWFPPVLGGLTYLTSHIFTMVASAPLWGRRSEFQTSWVITDFSSTPSPCSPTPLLYSRCLHRWIFGISLVSVFCDCCWIWIPLLSCRACSPRWFFPLHKSFPLSNFGIRLLFLPLSHFHCPFNNANFCYLGVSISIQTLFYQKQPASLVWCLQKCVNQLLPRAASHPPTKPPSHRCPPPLTGTPACGLMVYFLWMKGLNESAFLSPAWEEAAGCLVSSCLTSVFHIHSTPENRIKLDWEHRQHEDEKAEHQQQKIASRWMTCGKLL